MQIGPLPPLQLSCCSSSETTTHPSEMTKTASSTSNLGDSIISPQVQRPTLSFSNLRVFSVNGVSTTFSSLASQTQSCFTVCCTGSETKEEIDRRSVALRQMLKESKAVFAEPPKASVVSVNSDNVVKKTRCNCKKSGCLKMYCDCFRQKGYCEDCNCVGCMNTPQHEAIRAEAMQAIKAKNPLAFESLVVVKNNSKENEATANTLKAQHIKGCRCKKTNCLKKYCECFQLGVLCGPDCICTDCHNCEPRSKLCSHSTELEPCTKMKVLLKDYDINIKV